MVLNQIFIRFFFILIDCSLNKYYAKYSFMGDNKYLWAVHFLKLALMIRSQQLYQC